MSSQLSTRPDCHLMLFLMLGSVAKNRGWFTEYTPFKSQLNGSGVDGRGLSVEGVGTVEIPTVRALDRSGPSIHTTLRLTNVLHVPSCLCNIIGRPENDGSFTFELPQGLNGTDGQRIACFEPNRGLFILKLSEPSAGREVGPKVIVPESNYFIFAEWSDNERKKWEEYRRPESLGETPLTTDK
jgi:hypothetical protein